MQLSDLQAAIEHASGEANALAYIGALFEKITRLDATKRYAALLHRLLQARNEGDFRGRVLEVNFADAFVQHEILLDNEVRQGQSGDIDFHWNLGSDKVFIEMKMLGQSIHVRQNIAAQLAAYNTYQAHLPDDRKDIARIQYDILEKSSIRKFNPNPCQQWVNLVAIDVTELQLGMVDVVDCVLAALGSEEVSRRFPKPYHRAGVVGVFEQSNPNQLAPHQAEWLENYIHQNDGAHPRNYIHGVLYLFRQPRERAALSYALQAVIVWNPALVAEIQCRRICAALYEVIPCHSMGA